MHLKAHVPWLGKDTSCKNCLFRMFAEQASGNHKLTISKEKVKSKY